MRPLVVAERKSQHDADGESAYAAESLLVRAAAQRRVEADDAHVAPAAEVTDGMVPHGTGRSGLRATAPCPRGSSSLSPTEPASRRTLGHLGGPRPVLPRRLEHESTRRFRRASSPGSRERNLALEIHPPWLKRRRLQRQQSRLVQATRSTARAALHCRLQLVVGVPSRRRPPRR